MGKASIWKALLIMGVLVGVAKFSVNEYVRRDALQNVILDAYREHAIAACRHSAGATINPTVWSQSSEVRLAVGKADLDVNIWETSHRLWKARYQNAYIYVTINKPDSQIHCEYDIANSVAVVYKLGGEESAEHFSLEQEARSAPILEEGIKQHY
ncbi:MAG: hypothetical protein TECD_01232 [Hyphomicrobiaceae bacterium hypho_1]